MPERYHIHLQDFLIHLVITLLCIASGPSALGEIWNIDTQLVLNGISDETKATSNSLNSFITRKSFNIVHLNTGPKKV